MAVTPLHIAASRPGEGLGAELEARRLPLGAVLRQRGLISDAQLKKALRRQHQLSARLGDILRMQIGLSDGDLAQGLSGQWQAGFIDPETEPPDPDLVAELGVRACLQWRCLPWRHTGAVTVVAAVHPDEFEARRETLEATFGPVMLALVSERGLHDCLARLHAEELNRRAEDRVDAVASCRLWRGRRFTLACAAALAAGGAAAIAAPVASLAAVTCLALVALAAMTGLKAAALIAALRAPPPPAANAERKVIDIAAPRRPSKLPVVSLLVPLFEEAEIADRLVRRLTKLHYPTALLDIVLIVEARDAVTEAALKRTRLPATMRVVRVPDGAIRTKPRALNYALDFARGDIVGVYDAEDAPAADQIDRIAARFAAAPPEVACLQGRLGYYNASQNWLSRCFAIEYAGWFGLLLPGVARLGLAVPLGGTTLFFRRSVLEEIGGWDAHNVTEDADLGLRLARRGYRTELIDTVTLEEANCRIWPWIRQRSRWLKGYAMTYATHMRRPRALWRDLGPRAFLGVQAMFLAPLLQVLLAPALWSFWLIAAGLPHPLAGLIPTAALWVVAGAMLATEALGVAVSILALRRTGQARLWPWALTANPYLMLATFAGYKALAEMMTRPFFWDKTRHGHLSAEPLYDPDAAADGRSTT